MNHLNKTIVLSLTLSFLIGCGPKKSDSNENMQKPTIYQKDPQRLLSEQIGLLGLGAGLTDKGQYTSQCGSGAESVTVLPKPEIIYRLRTYPVPKAPENSVLVAEMVVIDKYKEYKSVENEDEQFFKNKEEFEYSCGTQYLSRAYSAARVAFLTYLKTDEANTISTFEMKETAQPLAAEFAQKAQAVVSNLKTVSDSEFEVLGTVAMESGINAKNFEVYKKAALQDPKMRSYNIEGQTSPWSEKERAQFIKK